VVPVKGSDLQQSAPAPVEQAIERPEFTSKACQRFTEQPASEQRRLLRAVVQDAAGQHCSATIELPCRVNSEDSALLMTKLLTTISGMRGLSGASQPALQLISKGNPRYATTRRDRGELQAGYDEIPQRPADSALLDLALRSAGRGATLALLPKVPLCLRR